jgi:hypothetical protein
MVGVLILVPLSLLVLIALPLVLGHTAHPGVTPGSLKIIR